MIAAMIAGLLAVLGMIATGPSKSPPRLTAAEVSALYATLAERRGFLDSEEARAERGTLGRFFGAGEYGKLRGNPALGYWDEGGFRWVGRRIGWEGITSSAPPCNRISAAAWMAAARYAASKRGLGFDPHGSVRIRGACVAAVIEPSEREPVPGVLLEMRFESPTGRLLYRIAVGKPTVEEAIGAAMDFLIGFAVGLR